MLRRRAWLFFACFAEQNTQKREESRVFVRFFFPRKKSTTHRPCHPAPRDLSSFPCRPPGMKPREIPPCLLPSVPRQPGAALYSDEVDRYNDEPINKFFIITLYISYYIFLDHPRSQNAKAEAPRGTFAPAQRSCDCVHGAARGCARAEGLHGRVVWW